MKVIVSDVDGTLFPHKSVKNPKQLEENIEAINRWVNQGNQFAIASARGIREVKRFEDLLGFSLNFIGSNGAGIQFSDGARKELFINSNIYYSVLKHVQENNWDASVVCSVDYKWLWHDADHYPLNRNVIDNALATGVTLVKDGDIPFDYPITKVSIFVDKNDRDTLKGELEALGFDATFTTCDVDMIDIIPNEASKANGILALCDHYGVTCDDVYVVGDSENDVSMFKVTKNSYCINHAEDKVKEQASHIVSSVCDMIDILLRK